MRTRRNDEQNRIEVIRILNASAHTNDTVNENESTWLQIEAEAYYTASQSTMSMVWQTWIRTLSQPTKRIFDFSICFAHQIPVYGTCSMFICHVHVFFCCSCAIFLHGFKEEQREKVFLFVMWTYFISGAHKNSSFRHFVSNCEPY